MPRSLLSSVVGNLDERLATPLPGQRGVGALLGQFLTRVTDDSEAYVHADLPRLANLAVDLVTATSCSTGSWPSCASTSTIRSCPPPQSLPLTIFRSATCIVCFRIRTRRWGPGSVGNDWTAPGEISQTPNCYTSPCIASRHAGVTRTMPPSPAPSARRSEFHRVTSATASVSPHRLRRAGGPEQQSPRPGSIEMSDQRRPPATGLTGRDSLRWSAAVRMTAASFVGG